MLLRDRILAVLPWDYIFTELLHKTNRYEKVVSLDSFTERSGSKNVLHACFRLHDIVRGM